MADCCLRVRELRTQARFEGCGVSRGLPDRAGGAAVRRSVTATVVRKAEGHEIVLEPEQITVARGGAGETQTLSLEAKYGVRIWLPGLRLVIHFTAASA
jgi:hypothetical protein